MGRQCAITDAVMEEVLDFLKYKMSIDEVAGGPNAIKVIGTIHSPINKTISEIKEYMSSTEYTPIFTPGGKHHIVQLGKFRKVEDKPKYWLNSLLFIATIITTTFGYYMWFGSNLLSSVMFSFSLMTILTCHELGHYFVSKRQGMVTSLPYFIPVPGHFIGTFGAVIRMKSIVPSRSSLLRVGMAGPVSGFLVALPITVIGIALSEIQIAPEGAGYMHLGNSLLFHILIRIIHPHIPQGADVFLHPMAFAGWLGFLVTSMNLIPVGQLDGGHVMYSVLLKKRKYLYLPIFACIIALGFLWLGWFIWGVLVFILARRDPIIQDSITPLSRQEKFYATLPFVVLILTFMPKPISI